MAELVKIPIAVFEVEANYESTDFRVWTQSALILQGIFDALRPWEPNVDDVEIVTTGKNSEQGVKFKLPLKRVSIFFGPTKCIFTRDGMNWEAAEETLAILEAAISAFSQLTEAAFSRKRTLIALHMKPKTIPCMEILNPFLPAQFAALSPEPVTTMAAVAKWESRKVTIDRSGIVANGIFLSLERDFDEASSYVEIVRQLRQDEDELLTMLGVEEDRG